MIIYKQAYLTTHPQISNTSAKLKKKHNDSNTTSLTTWNLYD